MLTSPTCTALCLALLTAFDFLDFPSQSFFVLTVLLDVLLEVLKRLAGLAGLFALSGGLFDGADGVFDLRV